MAKSAPQGLIKINILEKPSERVPVQVKFLRWLLSTGRFIVVLVELVVISAFVYRYKLDADLISLNEEIKQQSDFIKSLSQDEIVIRKTQFQISTISSLITQSPDFADALTHLSGKTPAGISLASVNFDRTLAFPKTSITINGEAASNLDLAAFLKALQTDSYFGEIVLSNISLENGTTFTITGNLIGKSSKEGST